MKKFITSIVFLSLFTSLNAQVVTGVGGKGTPSEDTADTEEIEVARSKRTKTKYSPEMEYQVLLLALGNRLVEMDKICSPDKPKINMDNYLQYYMKLVFTVKIETNQMECDEETKYLSCLLADPETRTILDVISKQALIPKVKSEQTH